MRLCFLIRQMDTGGAERQLLSLIQALDKSRFAVTLVTYYAGGQMAEEAGCIPGLQMISLDKRGRWDVLAFFGRLLRTARTLRPHVLHGYLSTSNLFAVLLKPFLPRTHIVWGVRASSLDLSRYDRREAVVVRLECFCSRFADLIIFNSRAGRDYWLKQGFASGKAEVVPNGIDAERFSPDPEERRRRRAEWAVQEDETLIGHVGRLDAMKGHPIFLRAAARLSQEREDVRFVCIGDGPPAYREELHTLGRELGLDDYRLIWAGSRSDMPAVQNALDIAVSSSLFGEGFPNVIGEAMACGVPCVVTDVGDSAWIVGETGVVVPPGDPDALVAGWKQCLAGDRTAAGRRARERIVQNFGVHRLAEKTEQLLCAREREGDR